MIWPGKLESALGSRRAIPPQDAPGNDVLPLDDAPINILIVDDEPINLVVLETVLDDPGYRLVRAESPEQALLALVEEEFALMILDIRMPGMTGFELAQMIKQRKKTASVPIIFLTAYYDKDQHEGEGYGTGAVDFLNKPVNPAILRSKVAVFADLHRKSRALTLANSALTVEVMERRRAEERLRELNDTLERRVLERTEELRHVGQKLQSVMSSITDGLFMLDRNWRYTYFNPQGARLLGMRPEQLIGGCVWDLFPHARGTKFYEGFHHAMTARETVAIEAFYPEPLNKWFECHCYPSDDGLSVYFHDISDRHEVETRRELLLAAEQAARSEGERVARAKDEFLASLSHELRTPLAAIVGWAKVLERRDIDNPTMHRGIEAIARNARAQARLVDDLLDMSRIVSGKLRVNIEPVDLNTIATVAADTARPTAIAKGVTIELTLESCAPAELMGDPLRLQQIASNLVTNALKFTPAGGVVKISTATVGSQVELTVSDTGQGIAAEFLPHIFDRFSQADGSAARLHGGLGLGLSIVKTLVEVLSGSVTASSAGRNQGSTFSVRFPAAAASASSSADRVPGRADAEGVGGPAAPDDTTLPIEQLELQGLAVLLVDDHADSLDIASRLLGDRGALVTTASTAAAALQCLRDGRFDVLLSDLGMPGMDGYELIGHVRSTLGLSESRLPAAAVTAYVRPEDRDRALQSGYQACIQKPVDPADLIRTVLALARGAREQAAHPAPNRIRALFVEDNADLREQIGWMLEKEGLEVLSCASGEDAEVEFNKGRFDVVITDISLPKMNGIEFARRVLERSPRTWVVFSTGYEMGDKLCGLGPRVRSLLKPFEADELHRLMDEVRVGVDGPRDG